MFLALFSFAIENVFLFHFLYKEDGLVLFFIFFWIERRIAKY